MVKLFGILAPKTTIMCKVLNIFSYVTSVSSITCLRLFLIRNLKNVSKFTWMAIIFQSSLHSLAQMSRWKGDGSMIYSTSRKDQIDWRLASSCTTKRGKFSPLLWTCCLSKLSLIIWSIKFDKIKIFCVIYWLGLIIWKNLPLYFPYPQWDNPRTTIYKLNS